MDPMGHDTVDGSEIRYSPVQVGRISPLFFMKPCTFQVVIAGFLNQQQYHYAGFELGFVTLKLMFFSMMHHRCSAFFPSRFDVETCFNLFGMNFN